MLKVENRGRLGRAMTGLAVGTVLLASSACSSDDDTSTTDSTSSSTATATTTTSAASGGPTDCSGGGAASSYCGGVQPIIEARCTNGTCHSGSSAGSCVGGHCSADFYADTQKSSSICSGMTVGECMLVRIQNGSMPLGAGCTGDPAQDAGNAACLTQAEQDTFQDWIDAGMPES